MQTRVLAHEHNFLTKGQTLYAMGSLRIIERLLTIDVSKGLVPKLTITLLDFVAVRHTAVQVWVNKAMGLAQNVVAQGNDFFADRTKATATIEVHANAGREYPNAIMVELRGGCDGSNVTIYNREVVTEGRCSHPHEVLLVSIGCFKEHSLRRAKILPLEILPCILPFEAVNMILVVWDREMCAEIRNVY